MSVDGAAIGAAHAGASSFSAARFGRRLIGVAIALLALAIVGQALWVVQARPGDLITGAHGMVGHHQPCDAPCLE